MEPIVLNRQQAQWHFSRIGLAFFLLIVVQQVVVVILTLAITFTAPQLMNTGWFLWVLSYVPLYLIAFPVFLLVIRKVPDTRPQAAPIEPMRLNAGKLLLMILIGLGVVYPLNLLAVLLSSLVELLTGTGIENPLLTMVMNSNPFVNFFFVVIVAPVMEEIMFRGILYKKLVGFGGKSYVLFSAFIFGLFHMNIYQVPYAFVLGLVFAAVTYYTGGSIKYTILLHMGLNFLGSGISPFLMAYTEGDTAVNIYTVLLLCAAGVGLILGIIWFVKRRRQYIHFAPGGLALEERKDMLMNAGMVLFLIIVALIMLSNLFAPLLQAQANEAMGMLEGMQH